MAGTSKRQYKNRGSHLVDILYDNLDRPEKQRTYNGQIKAYCQWGHIKSAPDLDEVEARRTGKLSLRVYRDCQGGHCRAPDYNEDLENMKHTLPMEWANVEGKNKSKKPKTESGKPSAKPQTRKEKFRNSLRRLILPEESPEINRFKDDDGSEIWEVQLLPKWQNWRPHPCLDKSSVHTSHAVASAAANNVDDNTPSNHSQLCTMNASAIVDDPTTSFMSALMEDILSPDHSEFRFDDLKPAGYPGDDESGPICSVSTRVRVYHKSNSVQHEIYKGNDASRCLHIARKPNVIITNATCVRLLSYEETASRYDDLKSESAKKYMQRIYNHMGNGVTIHLKTDSVLRIKRLCKIPVFIGVRCHGMRRLGTKDMYDDEGVTIMKECSRLAQGDVTLVIPTQFRDSGCKIRIKVVFGQRWRDVETVVEEREGKHFAQFDKTLVRVVLEMTMTNEDQPEDCGRSMATSRYTDTVSLLSQFNIGGRGCDGGESSMNFE